MQKVGKEKEGRERELTFAWTRRNKKEITNLNFFLSVLISKSSFQITLKNAMSTHSLTLASNLRTHHFERSLCLINDIARSSVSAKPFAGVMGLLLLP